MIKPGYKTSEFWFTLVSFLFSGLFLLGFIGDNDQKEELIRDVSHGVESIILIGGQLLILYNYINARKTIKASPIPVEEKTNEHEHQDNKAADKPRSNKPRSRKANPKVKRGTKRSPKSSS